MQILTSVATIPVAALLFSGAQSPQISKHSQPVANPAITQPAEKVTANPNKPRVAEPVTVTVQPGDTLSSIAYANGTTWQRIYDKNSEVENPDLILPGWVLVIPSADEVLPSRPLPTEPTVSVAVSETPAPTSPPAASEVSAPLTTAASEIPGGSAWDRLAACESGGNWSINTGNGFYGGLQFTLSSWRAVGGTGLPSDASRAEQIIRAEKLQAIQGWGAWPVCSYKAGLR